MSNTKVRVGIVGAGIVGGLDGRSDSHAGGYVRCEEVDVVAVADINEERLQQFGDKWEIAPEHRYTSMDAMFEKMKPDIVSVTTDNFHHHQPVIAAAEAGVKVILVEKPLAISVEKGRQMCAVCENNGARLITDHTRRFLPHFRKLQKLVKDGELGKVKTITETGCRPLLHCGTHDVDRAFMFTDAEPKLVAGAINDEEVADPGGAGMILCEGGVVIFVNCVGERKEYYGGAVITGSEGRLEFNEPYSLWRLGRLKVGGRSYGHEYVFEDIPDMPKEWDLSDYFYCAMREAVDCLLEDREGVSTGRDGLRALELIVGMHISHQTQTMVPLPLDKSMETLEIRSTGK